MTPRSRSFLYEIPIFFLLLFACQRGLFPGNFAFHEANPNPCWLGVLLFGLRYGLVAGFLSGLASAAFTIVGFWLGGEAFRFEDVDFYIVPGLFVVVGAAVGAAADNFLHMIRDRDSKLADLQDRNLGLVRQIQAQQKAQRAVEQQVVSQMSSMVTLYHGARELGSLDRDALFTGVMDFFTQAVGAKKASLYVPAEHRWVLRDQRGWQADDPFLKELNYTQGLIGQAGSEKRVVCLRDWAPMESDEASAERWSRLDSIMAGPLLDPAGNVAAVFSVQAMPFLRFNSASVNLLTLMLDWGNEALAKCVHYEDLKARSIMDEEFGVHNESYFRSRARQEFARSKRHALPFSMLLASLGNLESVPIDRQVMFLRVVSKLLRESVRDIDVVAKTSFVESPFAVLMMTATVGQARELRSRLLASYGRLGLPPELRIGVGTYQSEMENAEEMVEQAKADAL